jgi:PRC-barrel domain
MIDDGEAIHYSAVPRGTPVYGSDGVEIGTVDRVLDNYREHILDGFVVRVPGRGLRFVDAPEVARTAERGIAAAASRRLSDVPPEPSRRSAEPPLRRRLEAAVGAPERGRR